MKNSSLICDSILPPGDHDIKKLEFTYTLPDDSSYKSGFLAELFLKKNNPKENAPKYQ